MAKYELKPGYQLKPGYSLKDIPVPQPKKIYPVLKKHYADSSSKKQAMAKKMA